MWCIACLRHMARASADNYPCMFPWFHWISSWKTQTIPSFSPCLHCNMVQDRHPSGLERNPAPRKSCCKWTAASKRTATQKTNHMLYSSFWVYANLCNLIMLIFIIILLANIIINAKIPLVKMTAFVLWGISILPFPHSIPSVGLFLKYLLTLLAIIFTIVATKKDNSLKLKYFEQSVNPQN